MNVKKTRTYSRDLFFVKAYLSYFERKGSKAPKHTSTCDIGKYAVKEIVYRILTLRLFKFLGIPITFWYVASWILSIAAAYLTVLKQAQALQAGITAWGNFYYALFSTFVMYAFAPFMIAFVWMVSGLVIHLSRLAYNYRGSKLSSAVSKAVLTVFKTLVLPIMKLFRTAKGTAQITMDLWRSFKDRVCIAAVIVDE